MSTEAKKYLKKRGIGDSQLFTKKGLHESYPLVSKVLEDYHQSRVDAITDEEILKLVNEEVEKYPASTYQEIGMEKGMKLLKEKLKEQP